ncbi:MAG: FkbM family methyltransferase, partial [bacterium]|nr:FkbM family methyltransferase [bacterium]
YSKPTRVYAVTLDEYVEHHTPPTVVKIDVEGAEENVIAGGDRFLRKHAPTISLEVWPTHSGGEISMNAVEKVRDLGYQAYRVNDAGDLILADGDLAQDVENRRLNFDNYVFMKKR